MKNSPPKDIRVLIPGEWLIPLAASYWAPTKAGTDLDTGGAVVNEVNTCPQGACTLLWEQHWSSWQKCEHTDVWTRLYGLQGSSIITCGRLPHPLGGTLRFGLRSHQFPCWTPFQSPLSNQQSICTHKASLKMSSQPQITKHVRK